MKKIKKNTHRYIQPYDSKIKGRTHLTALLFYIGQSGTRAQSHSTFKGYLHGNYYLHGMINVWH